MRLLIITLFCFPLCTLARDYNQFFQFDKESFKNEFEVSNKVEAALMDGFMANEAFNQYKPLLSYDDEPNDEDYEILGMSPYLFAVVTTCVGGLIVSPIIAGPIAVLVVHVESEKNIYARRKAFWGCFTVNMAVVSIYATLLGILYAYGGI